MPQTHFQRCSGGARREFWFPLCPLVSRLSNYVSSVSLVSQWGIGRGAGRLMAFPGTLAFPGAILPSRDVEAANDQK